MKIKKTLAGILSVTLLFGAIPADHVVAAKKISMSKKLSLTTGETKILNVKNTKKTVKWKIVSGKKCIRIKKKGKQSVAVKGTKKGTAKIRATIGKTKLTCKVTVKNANEPQKTDSGNGNTPVQTAAAPGSSTAPSSSVAPGSSAAPGSSVAPGSSASPDNSDKNAEDVAALQELIRTQRANGATVDEDISNKDQYRWENGRLVRINWNDQGMSGNLDVTPFSALKTLECGQRTLSSDPNKVTGNQLSSLDVSKNTALETLWCDSNQLSSLDVSKNTALLELGCDGNQLSSLDVSNNTALRYLSCFDNQLTSLDLSNNIVLNHLECDRNQLSSLDVSHNTALLVLGCDGNQLSSLDVSNNTALEYLSCSGNQLTSLDLTNNTKLEEVEYDDSVTVIGYNK